MDSTIGGTFPQQPDRPIGRLVAQQHWERLNRMQIGDVVVTTSNEGALHIGRIAGEAIYVKSSDDRSNLRRSVEWTNPDDPIDFAELSDALTAKLSSQHTVVDLTNELASLEHLQTPPSSPGSPEPPTAPAEATLPDATHQLATDLLVDLSWLQEQIELLRERRQ